MKYGKQPHLPPGKASDRKSRYQDSAAENRSVLQARTHVPAIITGLCAACLALILALNADHHPVAGRPDLVEQKNNAVPLTHIEVAVEPRTINGRRRMPTWSELFEQYRLDDLVRAQSLAWFNARRTQAEPQATPNSEIPTGARAVIILSRDGR